MVKPKSASDSSSRMGRPRDPAKVEAILDASWSLFLAHGVEPVSVDTIAGQAKVAKATVYAYFPDKRALFQEGVRREMAKIEAAQRLGADAPPNQSLRDVLIAFGIGIMTFLTSPGAVDFYGSLSSELRRDPELARMFYNAGPGRTLANLSTILGSPLAAGLAITDTGLAAEMLMGLWQGMTSYKLMLGIDHDKVVNSIPDRVSRGVELFLQSVGAEPGPNDPAAGIIGRGSNGNDADEPTDAMGRGVLVQRGAL